MSDNMSEAGLTAGLAEQAVAVGLAEQAVAALRVQVRGDLIQPSDAGYDDRRSVHNAMIDKRPALIARCADAADVISAVNFARDRELTVAVRGGGHNGPGFGTCGGGGNFGIVTSFLFRGNPVRTVYGGPMIWPMAMATEVLKFWQDLILSAPDDLYGFFAFLTVPPGPPFPEPFHLEKMCGIVWCH